MSDEGATGTSPLVPADHLTRAQAAELLGVSLPTLANWIKAERLVPWRKIGHREYFLLSELRDVPPRRKPYDFTAEALTLARINAARKEIARRKAATEKARAVAAAKRAATEKARAVAAAKRAAIVAGTRASDLTRIEAERARVERRAERKAEAEVRRKDWEAGTAKHRKIYRASITKERRAQLVAVASANLEALRAKREVARLKAEQTVATWYPPRKRT